ncbi:AAA family ATPase [Paenibacillus sp. HGF5]|uniref:AAA family ATPase n=1 Tax=Paenibacillus sp. HGF5 TaxID=908341 RepID=UPI00056D81CE|nr:AAA family ATPase [Paenibacillus sp. HGF5]
MKRVLVIGCPGSGKSTFSSRLSKESGLPVIHLDSFYWKPGWISCNNQEFDEILQKLLVQETYIMDGNHGRTLDYRIPYTDTVYFFDFPRYLCLCRVMKRTILNHGTTGEYMGKGCLESIDYKFIKSVWNFRKNQRMRIINILEKYKGSKSIVIFRKPKEVKNYFKSFSK